MKRKSHRRKLPPDATVEQIACTTKVKHATETMARMAARCVLYKKYRDAMWVYPCEFCDGWHVTSRPSGWPKESL